MHFLSLWKLLKLILLHLFFHLNTQERNTLITTRVVYVCFFVFFCFFGGWGVGGGVGLGGWGVLKLYTVEFFSLHNQP